MLVFCLFIPFPHGYKVSRGVPVFSLAMINFNPHLARRANITPKAYHCRKQYHLPKGKYNSDKATIFIALSLKSRAFFGDDVFTAQVNFVINFTIFLRLSLVIKINRFLLRVKIGGKSPLFFGNAVRISPF